ncbi:hypothetical protein A3A93_02845 [Candidatus Roizmanbacteria bacterium RIFCSPLOWO2_01_FULL_38_12]|uniref:DUF8173 domain-containing protein n=1 Tax=Candidatus Roizmanbacteria bacterium RIFCSPLOWO2_01_FULL_38_12 TaxID=1802061 RepID=A0A1F7IVJ3_9BACT|nr:MAG: hypothetical protein A3F59_03505 [Candidatus Roizmanbacteria bacterium RIFCSPHIGHO2_12_FULL_38_13]OGK47389.1 MAG: hypothetical protein A3A93_02845 [Candidatus Roizmanbacteria bacterium RIFCSPLOWO2_01_FULL_38_12]
MLRYITSFVVIIFTLLIFGSIVFAKEKTTVVLLPKDEIVDTTYFAAGDTVTLSGTVNGDAYVAGGVVNIEGTVNGDLIAAGGVVNVRGTVAQDVRVAGGQVIITGTIKSNLTVLSGSATIADSASIGGGIVGAGGSMQIFSEVPGDVTVGAGELTIGNVIGGNVLAGVGMLTMSPNANVHGNLTYMSDEPINIQKGATVSGTIKEEAKLQGRKTDLEQKAKTIGTAARGLIYTAKVINIITAFIIGLLIMYLFPKYLEGVTKQISMKPWKTLGLGFLTILLTPLIVLLLFMTVIGAPIGILFVFTYFFYIYLAKIFVSLVIGSKLIGMMTKEKYHSAVILGLGLLIYLIVSSIPILGPFVVMITVFMGVGGLLWAKIDYYRLLHNKKMI